LQKMSRIIQTMLFIYFMEYFEENSEMRDSTAYLLASGIALCSLFECFVSSSVVHYFMRCGMQWQAATVGLLYRKALRLSNNALAATTSGHVIDLVAQDADKLDWIVWEFHSIWLGPLHAIIILTILYTQIGASAFSCIAIIVLIWPLQILFANKIAYYRKLNYLFQDSRVTIISDMISGMRVIKMYCWEKSFGRLVNDIRKSELGMVWSSRKWMSIMKEMQSFGGRLFTSIVIVVYVSTNNELSAAKVFPMFVLFNILSIQLMEELPWGLKYWKEVAVSCKRIEHFLMSEEIAPSGSCEDASSGDSVISVQSATAAWNQTPRIKTLNDISFEIQKGELVAVTGQVGSGKSSLLMALMSELQLLEGNIKIKGKVAYSGQRPWIFTSTIRQNIIFGQEMIANKYSNILRVTALEHDVSKFTYGDMTIVGDKGVTLSGGQKARVALARTLYSNADIYLLDEPLSALDSSVGWHVFNQCIQTYLRGKTCIIVTSHLQYLRFVDKICLMDDVSSVHACGIHKLIKRVFQGKLYLVNDVESLIQHDKGAFTKDHSLNESNDETMIKNKFDSEDEAYIQTAEIQQEEDREIGSVNMKCFADYFTSGNGRLYLAFVFFLCLLSQALYNIADWWLSEWTNMEENTGLVSNDLNIEENKDSITYMSIYVAITLGTLFIGLFKTVSYYQMSIKSSSCLHSKLYDSVVRAPISFFDNNPKGRIINRFSADIGALDNFLPDNLYKFIKYVGYVIGNMMVMVIIDPYLSIPLLPLVIGIGLVRRIFVRTQSKCQRITATALSPTLTHLCSSLEGIHTIRSSKSEKLCILDFDRHYDFFLSCFFTEIGVVSWFIFRIQFLSAMFNVVACILSVSMAHQFNAGTIGLSLSYLLPMLWYIKESTRMSAIVEIDMVSTERVLRYTHIKPEAPLKRDYIKKGWPTCGSLTFKDVNLYYKDKDELVLKNVSFNVLAGEKVGIVGRTGAGKSSLIQALFRLTEFHGDIIYDGQEIKPLGLHDVRSNISIIPQDPTLFCGTIRSNLDPFEEHSDHTLWRALKKVQLCTDIQRLPGMLNARVQETGGNFSVGQRQLMCMARATLRRNHILVMDEATANVDKQTDEIIQTTIRTSFSDCTVLTIAHRLNTVIDLDRIMVLDSGRLIEFDHPHVLLQNPSSALSKIISATRYSEQHCLRSLAKKSYEATKATKK
ncbi:hypothetical protein CAPTEDRAFT_146185, partial [Capitella teleta]